MTKIQLKLAILHVILIYIIAILLGFILKLNEPPLSTSYYETFKDSIPFILAIPAAYLGFCFQKRMSYLQSLRSLWSKLVVSVNNAIQYTFLESPSQEQYSTVIVDLRIVIDELRGVYKNVNEKSQNIGLYPYEPIKTIHEVICDLGFGELGEEKRNSARDSVYEYWKSIRSNFLEEFDRAEPTKIVSPYIPKSKKS